MGNTVAPCMCRKEAAGTAAVTTRGRRRPKSFVTGLVPAAGPDAAPPPRRLAVTPRKHQRDDVELEQQQQQQQQDETTTRAGPGRSRARARAGGVSWAGGVGDDDDAAAVGKQASGAAAVVTVKIVLKRKDAEALVARLNAQSARERKARMDELKGEFRAGDCGAMSPTPCRDAWKPSLAPIKENYPSGVSL
ncbi:uncharacterized protein LOC8061876 [Sorghum bicolor]|uniref:Uncharacterized protein n=1 Tax=Sorghum bicolor TaxID=4558 RepID=A0A1B6Q5E1_SORBI|nr:uncharacterized protein LOC8061876 [Sorghum bicolor]KXG33132.1 hypothetical protein SORBI_3003G258700 [Sorghum bicolor]|eukprot:XP_021313223.1 uncharacterized protein LOC8061876 [Sorghum bicolor]